MTRAGTVKRLACGVVVLAVSAGAVWAADLWGKLGISEANGKTASVDALTGGSVPFYLVAKAVKAAPPAARAALVVEGLTWVKSFVGSAEFKTAYATLRKERTPEAPVSKGTPDQQVKAQQDEQRKSLEDARKNLASLPPELRKEMEVALKQMEETIKKTAADPEMQKLTRQMVAAGDQEEQARYKTRVAEWEKDYPVDATALIARRLKQFVDTCGDVDFAAKLAGRDGKMHFAEQRYEEKSSEWKLCFRAGRETTEAARGFAKSWLAELTKK